MKTYCLLLILVSYSSFAQRCDCTIYPFKPDSCYRKCTALLMKSANYGELRVILGFEENTAGKLLSVDTSNIKTLEDYQRVLTNKEYSELKKQLGMLNEVRVDYFLNTSPETRKLTFGEFTYKKPDKKIPDGD